ncbi:Uncharacterized protein conserved in bacteria [Serratia plymuthica]|nr:Uncharacterized protein conserved in bacteria [Serratia plymuthica]
MSLIVVLEIMNLNFHSLGFENILMRKAQFKMNGCFALMLVVFSFSTYVCADSSSEQDNYLKIKNEYVKADGGLNYFYKELIQEYKKEGAEFYGQSESRGIYLKKTQLAWIKMRDVSCDYETYESRTGTAFSSIYEQCLLDKTNERIKYLKGNDRRLHEVSSVK